MPGRQAWGDDEDEDTLPPRQESAVDSKGVKSIIEYSFNENNAKVRMLPGLYARGASPLRP